MEILTEVLKEVSGPHEGAAVFVFGGVSKQALILLHGRGSSASDMASFYLEINTSAYTLIPEAVSNSWYPERFLLPQVENQPALDSALEVITGLLAYLEKLGIKKADTVMAGFSQGACLLAEYLKRYPGQYGGVALMSGGFIGSDEEAATLPKSSLMDTPVYLGCDRNDPHIPFPRVEVTAEGLTEAGATVSLELFDDYGHRPHISALQFLQERLEQL